MIALIGGAVLVRQAILMAQFWEFSLPRWLARSVATALGIVMVACYLFELLVICGSVVIGYLD